MRIWVFWVLALPNPQYQHCRNLRSQNNRVKLQFYIPKICVFHAFMHYLQGPGQIHIRAMFPRFYATKM